MLEFFGNMTTLEQVYWVIALIGSLIFVIIFILNILGGDIDADADVDFDGDVDVGDMDSGDFEIEGDGLGFQFFTFKGAMAFFTIFGWTGVVCLANEVPVFLTIIISTMAGLLMMGLTSLLFYWMYKLQASGTLKIKNAIGVVGEVYLPIGANRESVGKVTLKVQGSLRELDAVSDSQEEIKTGTLIRVIGIISGELLLVEKTAKWNIK